MEKEGYFITEDGKKSTDLVKKKKRKLMGKVRKSEVDESEVKKKPKPKKVRKLSKSNSSDEELEVPEP